MCASVAGGVPDLLLTRITIDLTNKGVGMATAIEWTTETWNPTTGCDRVSPGCDNCYAMTLHLFERPEMIERLQFFLDYTYPRRLRSKATVHSGDVNVTLPALLASGVIPRDKSCFAFVDPDSTEVDWATIAELAGYKTFDPTVTPILCKVEMWILVNTGHALQRLWPADRAKYPLPPADSAKTLDRVMGGRAAWADLYKAGEPSTQLAYRYADRLRSEFGYQHAVCHAIRRGSSSSGIQYFMVHATDHAAAVDFMTWAGKTPTEKIAREAQLPL